MAELVTISDIISAQNLIRGHLTPTPLSFSPVLSEKFGRDIFLKWESKLRSGAFKERGALNFLLNLDEAERRRRVCAASAGNHARGLSLHANRLGIGCTIFMPLTAPLIKIQACEKNGATVKLEGETFDDCLKVALKFAQDRNLIFVHPFNDPKIIAGQGTCGLEILEQCPDVDAVVVPVGGGGLISGISTAIKAKKPDCFILGVQSEWALAYQQGAPKSPHETTIADGIAVKKVGDITSKIIKQFVNETFSVTESEIRRAVVHLLELEKSVVEGSGAVGLCALLSNKIPESYKKIVLVISGGNIDMNLLSAVIQRDLVERGRILRFSVRVPDRPGLLNQVTGVVAGRGGNVLDVYHDRFTCTPGIVEIAFVLEVRDLIHGDNIISGLEQLGVQVVRRLEP